MKVKRHYRLPSGKELTVGEGTLVMGILNVTPDSFSDGGKWNTLDKALDHALSMVEDGAAIIDVGAESSRPGFVPVSAAEARVAAEYHAPVVVMHNQTGTAYRTDVIEAMQDFFRESCAIAEGAGVAKESLIFDPGIGFGKTPETNIEVLHRLQELCVLDGEAYPLLLGASRKSFIGYALDLPVEERLEATGAATVLGVAAGASIVRVHDVKEIARMCRMADIILEGGKHGQD